MDGFHSLPACDNTVGTPEIAMGPQLSGVVEEVHALNQITNQAGDEHHVQLDVGVLQDVLERSLGAEVRQEHDHVGLHMGANEIGDVGVPDLLHELHLLHQIS